MLPEEFLTRMQNLLGPEFDAFTASYDRPRAVGLRRNPLRKGDITLPFITEPVPWETNGWYYDPNTRPGLHPWHDAGVYYLQEPSAMAPAALLQAQPGERILDLCAAPGGKSTQIAGAMDGQGLLVSNELVLNRAKILSQNMERLGISNSLVLSEYPAKLAERFPSFFDAIMVDAPCSGEGMFRKEDAAVRDWSPAQVLVCANRQREILESAAKMLRPGGRMVYSTCTFAPEENEGVVSLFLREHPEFHVAETKAPWFSCGHPEWIETPAEGLEKTFRLFPHKLVGEGHFAAVLRKDGDGQTDYSTEPGIRIPAELQTFLKETGIKLPYSKLIAFGDTLYAVPEELPMLKGLKVLRAGLCLGMCRKGRFEPDHALALWSGSTAPSVSFPVDSPEVKKYLAGDVVPGNLSGWGVLQADGFSLGWVKGSGGILKNHLPKGLRRY